MRMTGSAGGHNGVRSLIDSLGTQDLRRVKIGIGRPGAPGEKRAQVSDHVLSPFYPEEHEAIEAACAEAADLALELVERGRARRVRVTMRRHAPGGAGGPPRHASRLTRCGTHGAAVSSAGSAGRAQRTSRPRRGTRSITVGACMGNASHRARDMSASIARGSGAWYTLTACSTGQDAMRDVGVRVEEASAPRQAQRRANVQGVGDIQEGAETSAYVRIAAGDGGVEWAQVRALLARDARTPMGRERALGLLPTQDPGGDHARARRDSTGPGRARARRPTSLGDHSRRAADPRRGAGARRRGGRRALAAMLPLLDAAARLTGYGRGIRRGGARSRRRLRRFSVPEAPGRPVAPSARGRRQRRRRGEPRPAPHPLAPSRSPQGHRAHARGVLSVARGGHHLPGALRHGPPRPLRAARRARGRRAACAASSTTDRRAAPRSSSSRKAWWRRTTNWCRPSARRRARSSASSPR